MGWNKLENNDEFRNDKILKNVNVENEEYVYYVHSYFAKADMKNIVHIQKYGTKNSWNCKKIKNSLWNAVSS